MATRHLVGLLLAAALLAPAASAHTANLTPDGKYRIVIGHLNEPITTYTKTGLDLSITLNDTARTPVASNNPGNLTVTLVAPDGTTLLGTLMRQFGTANKYSFTEPYVLTQPGVYHATINGTVLGSPIAAYSVVGSTTPVPALGAVSFPDADVPGNKELQDRVAALEALASSLQTTVSSLQSQLSALRTTTTVTTESKGAPGLELALLAVGLLGVALVRSRRQPAK